MKTSLLRAALAAVVVVVSAAISLGASAAASAAPLKVATLSPVLADVARGVGGDRVVITEIVKPGVDPHDFQPTPADVQQAAAADLVLVSGKGLEGYLTKLERGAGGKGKFVDVGGRLGGPPLKAASSHGHGHGHGHSHGHDHGEEDPHWWHSVGNARRATEIVRDVFIKANAADAEAFAKNAAAYVAGLDELEAAIKLKVAELPRERRKLVTSHDAFGYFARDYGFTVLPVEGVSTGEQPSAKRVAALLKTIRAQNVKAVFFESGQNPKVTAEITRETGAAVGGELFADGLAATGDASTYAGMMRYNVNTIVNALK